MSFPRLPVVKSMLLVSGDMFDRDRERSRVIYTLVLRVIKLRSSHTAHVISVNSAGIVRLLG